jgi:hypothetical protein
MRFLLIFVAARANVKYVTGKKSRNLGSFDKNGFGGIFGDLWSIFEDAPLLSIPAVMLYQNRERVLSVVAASFS